MLKKILPLLPVLFTGCVSTSTIMVNDAGQTADCGTHGWGWIGAPMALSMNQDCIKKYQAAGFHESVGPLPTQPAPVAQSAFGASTFKTTNEALVYTKVVPSRDGSFKITLPTGWVQIKPPDESYYQLAARSTLDYTYLLVSAANLSDVSDWQAFSAHMKAKLMGTLTDANATDTMPIKVNGYDALQAEVSGTLKSGLKVHYLATALRTDKKLVYVLSWTTESNFATAKPNMEHFPWTVDFS